MTADERQRGLGIVPVSDGPAGYPVVRDTIAADLRTFSPVLTISVAQIVSDLEVEIREFLDAGGTFSDAARIFERRGVTCSPDAVRMALSRKANKRPKSVRKGAVQAFQSQTLRTPTSAPQPQPQAPVEPDALSSTAADPHSHETSPPTAEPLVGRHLD